MKPWKFLIGLGIIVVITIFAPVNMTKYGIINSIDKHAYYILSIVTAGIVVKTIISEIVSSKFEYHKNGYDMCVMAFGSALYNAASQSSSIKDLFPGFSNIPALSNFLVGDDPLAQKRTFLFWYLAVTLVATMLTAYISKSVADPDTKAKSVLSLVNFLIGSFVLVTYVVSVIEKA